MSVANPLSDRPAFVLSDHELLARLDEITAAERALAAERLEAVAELCARGLPAARGYAHPTAFLREHLKLHPAAAGQMHRLATALPSLTDLADALGKGALSETQAAVIANAITAIAAEATSEEQSQAAAILISQAAALAPRELAVCGQRIMHHVAPEAAEERDRRQAQAAEHTAWQARAFTISPDGHGRYRLRGSTTAEGAALLHTVLDPLTHPRHRQNESNTTDTADTVDPGEPSHEVQPGPFRDPRSAAQRRHDAMLEALRLLLTADALPDHGGKPQVVVTVGLDPVTGLLGRGLLDTGAALSAAEVRKLAGDAGIIPAVLDGCSVPLDLGRERRLISGGLRRALILRDRGCAWPGCDRPPRLCQAHHAKPWHAGGETCLSNSALVCEFHHRLLHHDDGWSVNIGADGYAWFTPPAHLDPQQTPQRNLYHQHG